MLTLHTKIDPSVSNNITVAPQSLPKQEESKVSMTTTTNIVCNYNVHLEKEAKVGAETAEVCATMKYIVR